MPLYFYRYSKMKNKHIVRNKENRDQTRLELGCSSILIIILSVETYFVLKTIQQTKESNNLIIETSLFGIIITVR